MKKTVQVMVPNGLEARKIAELVQIAVGCESKVYIEVGEKKVNAKSIMGMMTLVLVAGDTVTVTADGSDEETAVDAIVTYLAGE